MVDYNKKLQELRDLHSKFVREYESRETPCHDTIDRNHRALDKEIQGLWAMSVLNNHDDSFEWNLVEFQMTLERSMAYLRNPSAQYKRDSNYRLED